MVRDFLVAALRRLRAANEPQINVCVMLTGLSVLLYTSQLMSDKPGAEASLMGWVLAFFFWPVVVCVINLLGAGPEG